MENKIRTKANLACPICGKTQEVVMPSDSCQYFYECKFCKNRIKSKEGDCCVFCSHADAKCPYKQKEEHDLKGGDKRMAKITVYSTTTCPYCHMLKGYLKEKGVTFEDIVLDYNPDKSAESMHICKSMSVPCTHIVKDDGSEVAISGFNKDALNKELGL